MSNLIEYSSSLLQEVGKRKERLETFILAYTPHWTHILFGAKILLNVFWSIKLVLYGEQFEDNKEVKIVAKTTC